MTPTRRRTRTLATLALGALLGAVFTPVAHAAPDLADSAVRIARALESIGTTLERMKDSCKP